MALPSKPGHWRSRLGAAWKKLSCNGTIAPRTIKTVTGATIDASFIERNNFGACFEDWFHFVGPRLPFDAELGPLCLNIAGTRTTVAAENHAAAPKPMGEAALERSLTTSKTFEQHF